MKHTIKGNLIIIALLLFMGIVSSCHKENTSFDYTQAIETIPDYVEAQQMTDLLLNTYFKSITDSLLLADGTAEIDGADVSYSTDPAIITIDYSSWPNKDDGYGHTRRGKYEATTETSFFDSLAVVNFTFSSFFYDKDSISAESFTVENIGTTNNNNYLFHVDAANIFREFNDTTGSINYHVEQSFLRINDPSSPYHTDNDYFEISGNLTGIAKNGHPFNSVIRDTSNLIVYLSCQWIKGGITEIELPDFIYNASLNFDNNGECLNQYSIITNETLFIKAFDSE